MLTRAVIAATVSAALGIGLASTASAAPWSASSHTVPSPDSCLTLTWKETGFAWHNQQIMGNNNCGQIVGFDVVNGEGIAWETSPCIAVAPGQSAGWSWTKGRKYRYSESCNP
jgi:hypothetical protein